VTDSGPVTQLSDEEQIFRDMVRDFAQNKLQPLVSEMDRDGLLNPQIIPWLYDLGLMAIEIPEEFGGSGCSIFMSVLAIEEIARVDPAVAVVCDVQNTLFINALRRWASEEQKAHWFPKLATGTVAAYALSEQSSGSDAFALKTRAVEDGDCYRLTGRKLWITNGAEAGLYLVFANVNPDAGYRGITGFLVERDMAGFSVGKKEDKLGIRASSTCELILEDVAVPKSHVLGEVGQGYKVAIETLNEGRIGIAAQMLGLGVGAVQGALAYVQQREQFGRKIGEFQAVAHRLAQCATEMEAARLMVYNTARLQEHGLPFRQEAAMAKWFASEVAERAASLCLELYGGVGFTKECPAEKLLRDAKIGKIYEGTSFLQLETIAKSLFSEGYAS
jgi:alkylation response protein AidB-like acyl-CoA dehydrogenase